MSKDMESDLQNETLKWLIRAEELFDRISPQDNRFAQNIAAYISDSRHFMEQGDLMRAFEAVIWAWAWLEIGKELGMLKEI